MPPRRHLGLSSGRRGQRRRQHGRRQSATIRSTATGTPVKTISSIVARDGTELWIDATGATTVQDVIDLVNNHVRNNTGTTAVQARLAATGNGIELVDSSTSTIGRLDGAGRRRQPGRPSRSVSSRRDRQKRVRTRLAGTDFSLTSEDRHTLEVDSVYNTLIRLRQALEDGDSVAIGRAVERLDVDLERVDLCPRRDRLAAANARRR